MPQKLSAQIVCPSPKVWDFDEKRLHWASVVSDDRHYMQTKMFHKYVWLNLTIQLLLMQPWMTAMANSVVWNCKWDSKIVLALFGLNVLHEGRKRSKNYIFSQTRKGRKFYQIRPQGRNILLILFQKEITQRVEIIFDRAFLFFKLGAPLQGKQSF